MVHFDDVSAALTCDLAFSVAQAARWYAVPSPMGPTDIRYATETVSARYRVHLVTHHVPLFQTPGSPSVTAQFLCRDATVASYPWWTLRMLAGLAEARYVLGAEPEDWTVKGHGRTSRKGARIPDAVYITPDGTVVFVEHDSGGYDVARVDAHIRAYAGLGPQLWVVADAARKKLILNRLRELAPERCDHRVVVARWW